jgi:hypothetical protein
MKLISQTINFINILIIFNFKSRKVILELINVLGEF